MTSLEMAGISISVLDVTEDPLVLEMCVRGVEGGERKGGGGEVGG
jgi:dihydroxyacetone kinase